MGTGQGSSAGAGANTDQILSGMQNMMQTLTQQMTEMQQQSTQQLIAQAQADKEELKVIMQPNDDFWWSRDHGETARRQWSHNDNYLRRDGLLNNPIKHTRSHPTPPPLTAFACPWALARWPKRLWWAGKQESLTGTNQMTFLTSFSALVLMVLMKVRWCDACLLPLHLASDIYI